MTVDAIDLLKAQGGTTILGFPTKKTMCEDCTSLAREGQYSSWCTTLGAVPKGNQNPQHSPVACSSIDSFISRQIFPQWRLYIRKGRFCSILWSTEDEQSW